MLLMIDVGGIVTVLYPNDLSSPNALLPASTTRSFSDVIESQAKRRGLAAIDINASSVGPTAFVAIMSDSRRSLKAFLPNADLLNIRSLSGQKVDADRVGPGLWQSTADGSTEVTVDEMEPQSWDVANLKVLVSK
jgi:hypothetical protein